MGLLIKLKFPGVPGERKGIMQEIIDRVISDFNKRISTKIIAEQKTEDPVYKFGFYSGGEAFKEARLIVEQIAQEYDMGWIPVERERPQTYIYDRLWLTIQYPEGFCRTIEGRYDRYENSFLHVNQKPIKEKIVAWKKYGVPSPYQTIDTTQD